MKQPRVDSLVLEVHVVAVCANSKRRIAQKLAEAYSAHMIRADGVDNPLEQGRDALKGIINALATAYELIIVGTRFNQPQNG